MRSPRFLAAAVAVTLTATLASATTPADARVDPAATASVATLDAAPEGPAVASGQRLVRPPASTRAAQRSEVTITSKLSRRKKPYEPYKFYLRGRVTGSPGPVAIQRATLCNTEKGYCNFRFYRKVWVNDDGVFDGQIAVPPTRRSWVWRARVGTVNGVDWWQTCTKTANQECVIPEST